MKIFSISASKTTNFSGVRKVISKINGATVTKFISPKGKELGFHVVAKNGDIHAKRQYADGLTIQYRIYHLPKYGESSYSNVKISDTKPNRFEYKLTNGRYYLSSNYLLKNQKKLLTKKGIVEFVNEQEKKWKELLTPGQVKTTKTNEPICL